MMFGIVVTYRLEGQVGGTVMKLKNVTIKGIAAPYSKEGEKVTEIILNSVDDEDYIVDDTPQGRKLLNHVNEMVKVTGDVRRDENGVLRISIKGFQPQKSKGGSPGRNHGPATPDFESD